VKEEGKSGNYIIAVSGDNFLSATGRKPHGMRRCRNKSAGQDSSPLQPCPEGTTCKNARTLRGPVTGENQYSA